MFPKDENFIVYDPDKEEQLRDQIYNMQHRDLLSIVNEQGMDVVLEMLEEICNDRQNEDTFQSHKWHERKIALYELRHKHWSGQ